MNYLKGVWKIFSHLLGGGDRGFFSEPKILSLILLHKFKGQKAKIAQEKPLKVEGSSPYKVHLLLETTLISRIYKSSPECPKVSTKLNPLVIF